MLSRYLSSSFLLHINLLLCLITNVQSGLLSISRTEFSPKPVYAITSFTERTAFSLIFISAIYHFIPFCWPLIFQFFFPSSRFQKIYNRMTPIFAQDLKPIFSIISSIQQEFRKTTYVTLYTVIHHLTDCGVLICGLRNLRQILCTC